MAVFGCFPAQARTALPADQTLYIDNINGSDTNGCTSVSAPCATFARAARITQTEYDTQGYSITIQAAPDETWSDLVFDNVPVGGGQITFDAGGGTVGSSASGSAALIVATPVAPSVGSTYFEFQNGTVTCSNGANGLEIDGGLVVTGTGVTFGSCSDGVHIYADSPASRYIPAANYTINGGAYYHYFAIAAGVIEFLSDYHCQRGNIQRRLCRRIRWRRDYRLRHLFWLGNWPPILG
jgi:hypothetical protein